MPGVGFPDVNDTEDRNMQRWAAAGAAAALGCIALLASAWPAVAAPRSTRSGPSVKVSPSRNLGTGQSVSVAGSVIPNSSGGEIWFVTQCTAAVRGSHFNPSTASPHCNLTAAKAIHVSRNGTFATHYQVATGIIGDGWCGTAGHLTCVLGVGTASGLGTVVRITFRSPPTYPATAPTS